MPLDESDKNYGFTWAHVESPFPRAVIEEGDQVELHHDGKVIKAIITAIKRDEIVGLITRSEYDDDPDLYQDYVSRKEITFSAKNIFGVEKKRQA